MNGYENAPATKMLATNCVVCGRPLVDAISVEMGIGPECRKEYDGGIAPAVREEANKIVHDAAMSAGIGRVEEVLAAAAKIEALGLSVLADKMRRRFKNAERLAEIEIEEKDGKYRVITPYRRKESEAFVAAWRAVPGRRWENGANVVPVESKKALWAVLCRFFGGRYAKGPKGVFRIPEAVPAPVQGSLKLA
jgi:hypothetical protein